MGSLTLRIKAVKRFRVRLAGGAVDMVPGMVLSLRAPRAGRLLERAGDSVRVLADDDTTWSDETPPCGLVWWENAAGILRGPATIELIAQGSTGWGELAWVGLTGKGVFHWVRQDRIRVYRAMEEKSNAY